MSVFPNDVRRLLCLRYIDVLSLELECVDLKCLVIGILRSESAKELLRDEKLLEVLVLVFSHLVLSSFSFRKVSLSQSISSLSK